MFHVTDMLGQTNDKRGSTGSTGDRYPYLALNNGMVFVTEKDGTGKETGHLRYTEAVIDTYYEIEVHQIDVNGVVKFEVLINGTEFQSLTNSEPLTIRNAHIFLSDEFNAAAMVTVTYFRVETYGACEEEEYTGLQCDQCIGGWYLDASDTTCKGELKL